MITLMTKFSDAIGIIGVIFLLTAFFFLNTGRLSANDLRYQLLNLGGAILILYSLMFSWNTASVLIEVAWITISLIGIIRKLKSRET